MKRFITARRAVAVGGVGLLAVIGIGVPVYAASSTTGSSSSAPAKTAGGHRSLLARADRATVEIKVKGTWVTYSIDRGTVTSVSATSITLALPDGQSVSEPINSSTKFTGVTSESAVIVGKRAAVVSTNLAAVRVSQRAATAAPTSQPAG